MRKLIINADDLGINPQRSHGIFQCAEFGVVTSVSIIPNCPDSPTAAKHAQERSISAGLHLNLTEEYPLSPQKDIESLTEANGKFVDKEKFLSLLRQEKINHDHLAREIRAQVEWMFDVYGSPTHVDGHDYIHCIPAVAEALLPIMERYGIQHIRIPHELPLPPFGYEISSAQLAFVQTINEQTEAIRSTYAQHGISSTDHFRGLTLAGNASLKNFRHILARLPEGTTELMVHPSSAITYGTPFDLDPQRQTELRMLLDPSIQEVLKERKITLINWTEVM